MNIIESALALIAPHVCLGCGLEGQVLCQGCMYSSLITPPSRCYRCFKATGQFAVCASCRACVPLRRVYISAEYSGLAKELVKSLKFKRAKAAHQAIAIWLGDQLPLLDNKMIVIHVPTANSRVRIRGYDQSRLIARALARRRGLQHRDGLSRKDSVRQVGASRKERLRQLEDAFAPVNTDQFAGRPVLLVDDVLTTGATIEAAARALKAAGAKSVEAVVFAH